MKFIQSLLKHREKVSECRLKNLEKKLRFPINFYIAVTLHLVYLETNFILFIFD